jgi:hypothetical protein
LAPAVDVEETDDAYVVKAELPGVKRDDVQVEASSGVLTITGEFKERERTASCVGVPGGPVGSSFGRLCRPPWTARRSPRRYTWVC